MLKTYTMEWEVSHFTNSAVFSNFAQKAFDPPPPLRFEYLAETICPPFQQCLKKQAERASHYSAFQFFLVGSGHIGFTARLKLAPQMLLK